MPIDLPSAEARAYAHGRAPAPLLDLVGAMAGQAAAAGAGLGVFEALSRGPRHADALAGDLGCDPSGLGRLLTLLHTTGYLELTERGYGNAPVAAAWLCPPAAYGHVMRVWQTVLGELWADLAPAIRTGTPRGDFTAWLAERPEVSGPFQSLQRGLAEWLAEEVARLVPLPEGPLRLLDLAGGHGAYSLAFCAAYPGLTATVADLPEALGEGGHGRVEWRAAAPLLDPVAGRYDVVLLCDVLHGFPVTQAERLVEAAVSATVPGGRVVILETVAGPCAGVAETAFTAGFDLNLWHTQGGGLLDVPTITGWLGAAGCGPIEHHDLRRSATHALITARQPWRAL
jgi:2-hydroxy-4-(methylsulfanyl)butanoate S-methyltransferase